MYNYRKKNIIMIVMFCMIMFMTVGYALLSTNLNIKGISDLTGSWNIEIISVVSTPTGRAYNITEPVYTETTMNFDVGVKEPGDKMTFTITVKNFGDIDALLENIDATGSGNDVIIYGISGIQNNEILEAGESKTFTVTTEFDINATTIPQSPNKKLDVTLNYIQYDGQTVNPSNPIISGATLTTLSGNNSITLTNNSGLTLANYTIKGNSVQNGDPTPENPIEIKSVGEKTKNLIDYTKAENGTLGSSTGQNLSETAYPNRCRSPFIYLEAGDYVISFSELISTGTKLHTYSKADQTTYISSIDLKRNGSVSTFTLSSASYIRYTIQPIDTSSDLVLNTETLQEYKPMLEKGTTPTDYEPYGYKIPITVSDEANSYNETYNIYLDEPLRKVGDSADYIDFREKKIVKNIGKYILKGNSNVKTNATIVAGYQTYQFVITTYNWLGETHVLSSKLPGDKAWGSPDSGSSKKREQISMAAQVLTLRIAESRGVEFSSTGIKAWLEENNIDVYFPMKTPDPQPIELPNIYVPSGNVTVSINSNGVDVPLELSYYKK